MRPSVLFVANRRPPHVHRRSSPGGDDGRPQGLLVAHEGHSPTDQLQGQDAFQVGDLIAAKGGAIPRTANELYDPSMVDRFAAFETRADGPPRVVLVRSRDSVTSGQRDALVRALDAIPWSRRQHAYGEASDAAAELYAITLGDTEARTAAWWELWGNVHHQGTVYSATVDAVPLIGAIAIAADHPDRVQALCFLRAVAVGDGQAAPAVRAAVRLVADQLLRGARSEPELVQRAIVWLLSAFPSLVGEHGDLLRLLPSLMRKTWEEVLDRVRRREEDWEYDEADDDLFDRQDDFERWALAGWVEPGRDGA